MYQSSNPESDVGKKWQSPQPLVHGGLALGQVSGKDARIRVQDNADELCITLFIAEAKGGWRCFEGKAELERQGAMRWSCKIRLQACNRGRLPPFGNTLDGQVNGNTFAVISSTMKKRVTLRACQVEDVPQQKTSSIQCPRKSGESRGIWPCKIVRQRCAAVAS